MLEASFLDSRAGTARCRAATQAAPARPPRGRVALSSSREGQVSDQARRPDCRRTLARHHRRPRAGLRGPALSTAPTAPSCCPPSPTWTPCSSARATQIDDEALAAAPQLKVVARAGVGLDNVDVKAATQAGVMVVNAPTSNITSAAELAVGLLLATARATSPPANRRSRAGQWKRSKYSGVELLDKTVGIVGLGRIGVLVAAAAGGVRHESRGLRPLRRSRPRRASWACSCVVARRAAARRATSSRCTCPRRPRPWA